MQEKEDRTNKKSQIYKRRKRSIGHWRTETVKLQRTEAAGMGEAEVTGPYRGINPKRSRALGFPLTSSDFPGTH